MENQKIEKPLFVDFSELMPFVDAEIAKGKGWTSTSHGLALANAAIKAYETASMEQGLTGQALTVFVARSLDQHGLGGNASQFRQYLASKGKIAKAVSKVDKYSQEPGE
jgi:hypothetical protein